MGRCGIPTGRQFRISKPHGSPCIRGRQKCVGRIVSGSAEYIARHLPRRQVVRALAELEPQQGCGLLDKGLADKTEGPGPSAKKGKGLIGEPGYLARHGRPSVVRLCQY